jgi:hypothetical protein
MATLVPGTAATAKTVPDPLFGQHLRGSVAGTPSTLPRVGSVRLWDSGVTWRDLEPSNNAYRWNLLESALGNIEGAYGTGVEIMYTLGNTPEWAAAVRNSPYRLYGPGSNSHPANDDYYLDFLDDLITRFGDRIDAYQIWNEANLRDFYVGTPKQMATLTVKAGKLIKQRDPSAKVVAASTTVRSKGPVGKFGKAYGPAMRKAKAWKYVDAVSVHLYPPATKGPSERVKYIKKIKKYYKRYGAKKKQIWDTEMNYGDTRSYMKTKRQYTGTKAATYVARTFIDSMRYGVSRVHWYGWDTHVLGTDMVSRTDGSLTAGGKAFIEVQKWMSGKNFKKCKTKKKVTTCTMYGPEGKQSIRYSKKSKKYKLPKKTREIRYLDGTSAPAKAGQKIRITSQPILIIGA